MTGSESVTDNPEKSTVPRVQGKKRTIKKGQLVLRCMGVGNVVSLHCTLFDSTGSCSDVDCFIWDASASEIMMKPECQRRLSCYKQRSG